MSKEDRRQYIFAQLGSLPNATQYVEVTKYIEDLEQQVKKQKEVIDKIEKHCETEINASNHYLKNYSSQQELCHKVAHQRILNILKEVSE